MTDKALPPEHGAKVSAALAMRAEHRLNMATKRAQEISEGGRFVPMVTDDQWDEIIERIASGEISAHVMKSLELSHSALSAKRRRDPGFNERYKDALEDHYVAVFEDVRMITRGVDGYSTGDVRRDALVAEYDIKIARTMANKVLSERIAVDQTVRVAPVMLPSIAFHTIDPPKLSGDRDDDDSEPLPI